MILFNKHKKRNQMNTNYLDICFRSLDWARNKNFKGYSKFDALNSPILRFLAGNSRFLRSSYVFGISRLPINIRPLLFVKKKQNPKGLALFARSYFNLYQTTKNDSLKEHALDLLEILLNLSEKDNHSGHCWGYDHPWQNIAFFIPPYEPNCVVTCAVAEAFLHAYHITNNSNHLDVCKSVADFLLKDLNHIEVGSNMQCLSYDLHSSWKVINVNSFVSAFLAKLYNITKKTEYKIVSQAIMRWIISQKTDYNAWYYSDPPEASRITHDNYHTGFVLDSIQEYLEVFSDIDIEQTWRNGLTYYKSNLFNDDFSPKWMYNQKYPNDIHGATQGIITFAKASVVEPEYLNFSKKILYWTITNLYESKKSHFYYQKGRIWKKKYTLMRWSQAWMCYAMSVFIKAEK